MAIRLRKIDSSNILDHSHIEEKDECLFLHEYTSGRNYTHSDTNSLISNLKKKKGSGGYKHKIRAIEQCASELASALNIEWLKIATLVPIPPSKMKSDDLYDDRINRICKCLEQKIGLVLDIRDLVIQKASIRASHESDKRVTINELEDIYIIDESISKPTPKIIGIVDDVLTAGTHYKAMRNVLERKFPKARIIGIFIARRIFPNDKFEE